MSYTNGLDKPTDYFNTVLYTGNGTAIGSGGNAITGVGFQPDFVWIKDRSSALTHHLQDVVRGSTKALYSNLTNAEGTSAENVNSFDSDGFTVGSGTGVNTNADNFVSWNWLAGGTASSNTDGSITSSVSANTTAGFSIVSFTGTGSNGTVGHSLNSAPEIILLKNRSATAGWNVGSDYLSSWEKVLELQSTNAESTSANKFNSTAPTSSVFSVGTGSGSNGSGNNIIAYCFHSVKGYSKINKYTGNGNSDGTFVYTGFKPAFLMIKNTASGITPWLIYDTTRNEFNVVTKTLVANTSDAEATTSSRDIDILSNGFKARDTSIADNQSGSTHIYMAFAESPFVTSTGIPTTAR